MVATQMLREAVAEVMRTDLEKDEMRLLKMHGAKAETYPLEVVELVCKRLASKPHLYEILRGSTIACPPPPPPKKKNAENEKRLAQIKRELEEREYANMVKDVRRSEIAAEGVVPYPNPLCACFTCLLHSLPSHVSWVLAACQCSGMLHPLPVACSRPDHSVTACMSLCI